MRRTTCLVLIISVMGGVVCAGDMDLATPMSEAEARAELKEIQRKAEAGNAEAQYHFGLVYSEGIGVPKDNRKANEWFAKAGKQGYADAQFKIGTIYTKGLGVPQNNKKAAEWWRKAAEKGHAKAQFELGMAYAEGKGVPKDSRKSAELITKSAEQDYLEAQAVLGYMYRSGAGVPKDDRKSYAWFSVGSASGCPASAVLRDTIAAKLTPEQLAKAQSMASDIFEQIQKRKKEGQK